MSRCRFVIPLFICWTTAAGLVPGRAEEPFRFPQQKLAGKGELKYVKDTIPLLIVEGTPKEIGEQVATLAAKPAKKIFDYPLDFLTLVGVKFMWPVLVLEGEKMVKRFPADNREELEALIKTSGVERQRVVAGNTMFDIKKMFACSALIVEAAQSATKGPLLGRNLDYASLGYAQQYSLVTIYRPAGKHAFVSVGFPGIVGCLSGMNDAGLTLGVLEVFQVKDPTEKYDSKGTPYALCYRRLLEECTTVDEAEKLLRTMNRTTTTNLVICDKKGGAVFEVTAKNVLRRAPQEGVCPCTNHFCSDKLKVARPIDFDETLERFQALEDARTLARERPLKVSDVHRYLHATNLGELTLQTMVFEPAELRLHLAIGSCPASARELVTVELAPYLRK